MQTQFQVQLGLQETEAELLRGGFLPTDLSWGGVGDPGRSYQEMVTKTTTIAFPLSQLN